MSESKTSNVLERSSGKNKEVIIAVPKTSNVLERSSGKNKEVRSKGTERRTTYTTRPKRDVQRITVNGSMECQNAGLGNMEFDYLTKFNKEFLQELGNICGVKGVLPQFCVLANPPISKATPDGKRLRIKHVRSRADGHLQKVKWAHFQCHFPLFSDTQETIDVSPGGRSVETLDAPKHHPHTRRYPQSPPDHLGLDPRQELYGTCHWSPRC